MKQASIAASVVLGWTLLIGAIAAHPANAGEDAGVGVVAEYRPASSRFTFTRPPKGEAVPVRIGGVVMAGDLVTLPAAASVSVQLSNGELSSFQGPGTFSVPEARPIGRIAALWQAYSAFMDTDYRLAGTAASRGGESCDDAGASVEAIEVPVLRPGARIVAGKRDLPLAWRGGCPPFTVEVSSNSTSVARRESLNGRSVRLDGVPLSVGRYSVVVSDTRGTKFEAELESVAAAPGIPQDFATDASSLGVVTQAMWLASQDDGKWRLDAFEKLRPLIRAGNPLAGVVGDNVMWGMAKSPER